MKSKGVSLSNRVGIFIIFLLGCTVIADVAGIIEISRTAAGISLPIILIASYLVGK